MLVTTAPLDFIYGIFHNLFTRAFTGLGEYLLEIAISIDQLGNVVMQHLFNKLWISKAGYKFGNGDETISSFIGKNLKAGTLSRFGKLISQILDTIDTNHSLNSIDYDVKGKD